MGARVSTRKKVDNFVQNGNILHLKHLLENLELTSANFCFKSRKRYLDFTNEYGRSPLSQATVYGSTDCVQVLLHFGANVHYMHPKLRCGSALHAAVKYKLDDRVELFLLHGANPFVEDQDGFTAMDIACSTRNVPLLRRLEKCAPFVGWVMMKVPQSGGVASTWQRRWVVVSHRHAYPFAPRARQLTHCVLLAYKTRDDSRPCCRVWLNGAHAYGVHSAEADARLHFAPAPGAPRIAQAGITLHPRHEQPTGVYTTGGWLNGEVGKGFTFYLRPDDDLKHSVAEFNKLISIVNHDSLPTSTIIGSARSQPRIATKPGIFSIKYLQRVPISDSTRARITRASTDPDEEYARCSQELFDKKDALQLLEDMGSWRAEPEPSAPPLPPAAAEYYAAPSRPEPKPSVENSSGAVTWRALLASWLSPYPARPAAAAAGRAPAPPRVGMSEPNGSGGGGGNAVGADSDTCVVCLDAPATAGVLHLDCVHKCLCSDCALKMKTDSVRSCPVCRKTVESYIMRVF